MMVASYEGLVPSDGAIADLDGDGLADLPIGRIPAVSAGELTAYVNKVKAYESGAAGAWAKQVLMAADAPDAPGDHLQGSDSVAALLPAGFHLPPPYPPAPPPHPPLPPPPP